ncbi:MAG TPA: hypothetical protein VI279_13350 [Rhodocyclaceae bacterium]
MSPQAKRSALALALGATLLAAWFAPGDEAVVGAVVKERARATALPLAEVSRGASLKVLAIRPRNDTDDLAPAFPSRSWDPPKQKAEKSAEPPPPPQAPPLPFKLLGRFVEEGRLTVFLQQGERNLAVHDGDVIDETYRVAGIAGGVMTFIYLPLDQKQNLPVGDSN